MRSGIHHFLANLGRAPEICVRPGEALDITSSLAGDREPPKARWDALYTSFSIPARVDHFGRYVVPQVRLFLELDYQLKRFRLKRADVLSLTLRGWTTKTTAAVITANLAFGPGVYRTNNMGVIPE